MSFRWVSFYIILSLSFGGCGYTFQNSKNMLYEHEQVQKIYVAPLDNVTLKGGLDVIVFNNLLRTIVAHRKLTVVSNVDEADAVLSGSVTGASYSSMGATGIGSLNPQLPNQLPGQKLNFLVNTIYAANLSCSFGLTRTKALKGKKPLIWSGAFTKQKSFPGANQLDVPGTTSALINESEFDRALSDLSRSMMDDVHESMVAMF